MSCYIYPFSCIIIRANSIFHYSSILSSLRAKEYLIIKKLIKINHFKRLNIFGVCNGFSAFKKVTEREIPNESQMFLGHIPPADFLIFPEPKPADWDTTKKRLISEWFVDEKK